MAVETNMPSEKKTIYETNDTAKHDVKVCYFSTANQDHNKLESNVGFPQKYEFRHQLKSARPKNFANSVHNATQISRFPIATGHLYTSFERYEKIRDTFLSLFEIKIEKNFFVPKTFRPPDPKISNFSKFSKFPKMVQNYLFGTFHPFEGSNTTFKCVHTFI